MKVGLAGFPGSGKSTVFAALTGLAPDGTERRARLGSIKVPDERVDALARIYNPKKTTYAEMTFVDFPPSHDATKRQVLDDDVVAALRDADALVVVVRAFADVAGAAAQPLADLEAFDTELVLADLGQVEKRLERLRKEGGKSQEIPLLERLSAHLESGAALRTLSLGSEERTALSGFGFLSLRPLLVVLNVSEDAAAAPVPPEIAERASTASAECLVLSAQVEAEVAELPEDDRTAFLEDLGLAESARARFIRSCYGLLDLVSFLTAGEDECRAWPIRRGTPARKAAGKIHSDIERGFIRAEVVAFDDLTSLGSEAKCREAGKLRLEGKDYIVADGDVAHFRFAV